MEKVIKIIADKTPPEQWITYFSGLLTIKDFSDDEIQILNAEDFLNCNSVKTGRNKVSIITIPENFSQNKNASDLLNQLTKTGELLSAIIVPKKDESFFKDIPDFQTIFCDDKITIRNA